MAYEWRPEAGPDGVTLTCVRTGLFGRGGAIPPADWPSEAEHPGRALLDYLVQADQAAMGADGARLPHAVVAGLTETQANLLGLPPSIPHALQVHSHGRLDQPDFALSLRWLRFGQEPVRVAQTGALATEGDRRYRIPAALLRVLNAVQGFQRAETADHDARVRAWMPVQEALSEATGS